MGAHDTSVSVCLNFHADAFPVWPLLLMYVENEVGPGSPTPWQGPIDVGTPATRWVAN